MNEFAYADILILALIAGFIILRLRNTVGKDIGHRPDLSEMMRPRTPQSPEERVIPLPGITQESEKTAEADEEEKAESQLLASIDDREVTQGLQAIRNADEQFRAGDFLEGAKSAFEWVLKAFNEGDKETLKQLMAPEVFKTFEQALAECEQQPHQTDTTLVSIPVANITHAELQKGVARIAVAFASEQIIVKRDTEGKIVEGDLSQTRRVEDEWVFQREVKSRNPNWLIVET